MNNKDRMKKLLVDQFSGDLALAKSLDEKIVRISTIIAEAVSDVEEHMCGPEKEELLGVFGDVLARLAGEIQLPIRYKFPEEFD